MAIPNWWKSVVLDFQNKTHDFNDIYRLIRKDTNKKCVIVEPRNHELLEAVLRNFMYYLAPKDWGLIIYHGTQNKEKVKEIVKDWGEVELRDMGIDNLTIMEYNLLMTSEFFWQDIGVEHILIFQTDTFIRNNNADEFLEWDYIGAPWKWLHICGNGGLSMRRRSAMIKCCKEIEYKGQPEDIYYCVDCKNIMRISPEEVGKRFSVESEYFEYPFGFHKAWIYHNIEKLMRI